MKLPRLPGALARAAARVHQMVPARQTISGQLVLRTTTAARFLRTRPGEALALGFPFALLAVGLAVGLLAPAVLITLTDDASIANVAAVQGAVTGLSLIALVLAVEMARRQEDRDDVVYEIMLRAARTRSVFIFAIAALISTLVAMAIVDMGAAAAVASNLLLVAYALVVSVSGVLMVAVLQTMRVLRPTGVIAFRIHANEDERRRRINRFLAQQRGQSPRVSELKDTGRVAYEDPRTSEERLFVEIDVALASKSGNRFEWAKDQLQDLIEASADQIAARGMPFRSPGQSVIPKWYPLDALTDRMSSLWRAIYQQEDIALAMSSLQYWLLKEGAERRSGELLEVGLQSGLQSYRAARREDRAGLRIAWREWSNLDSAAWRRLRKAGIDHPKAAALPFAERLVEHLQEYGDMLLLNDDWPSFEGMLVAFHDTFEQLSKPYARLRYDRNASAPPGFNIQQHVVLALLALAGRAMLLEASGTVADAKPYVQALDKFVDGYARIERFANQIFERERGLQRQWSWWETPTEETIEETVFWVMPERYVMLALLYQLLKDQSDEPLPSFDRYAQRFIDAWKSHSDIIMKAAEIDEVHHTEVSGRVVARLETSVAAEQRERDDRALAAGIDRQRVTDLITELRKERAEDRVLEYRFGEVDRVRWVNESDWSDGRLGQGWLLPRDAFAVGSTIEPMHLTGAVSGFERGLFAKLAEELKDARAASQLTSTGVEDVLHAIDVGLHELACAQPLSVLHGKWPREAVVDLWQHSSVGDRPLSWAQTDFRQVRVAYKGHWLVQSWTEGDPVLLMLDLDRWGWLIRAPIGGEEFGLAFEQIDHKEAERIVDNDSDQSGDREERIREQMLKVRLVAQERVKFEVENPDTALRIPVRTADET